MSANAFFIACASRAAFRVSPLSQYVFDPLSFALSSVSLSTVCIRREKESMENAEDENKKRRASDQAIRSSIDAKRVKVRDEEASSDNNDVVLPKKERWQGECNTVLHTHTMQ